MFCGSANKPPREEIARKFEARSGIKNKVFNIPSAGNEARFMNYRNIFEELTEETSSETKNNLYTLFYNSI